MQYLYQYFNSDSHIEDDISIVPIEEVKLTHTDKISLSAKRLKREDFWYREFCTVYPYGLNDNIRKVGNVSKLGRSTVVHALFNRQPRKFKKRQGKCVIFDQLQYMTKVNINVEPGHKDLLSFYWLPKLHKNPYGKRFIAA